MEKVVVLIPCLNESKTVGKVVSDFKCALPHARVCVFDNNSNDSTINNALKAGAEVFQVPYKGKGNVVKEMFRKIDADIYVLVDGDDTYPAASVEKLISPIRDNKADMVVGDRLSSTYFSQNKRRFHNSGNILMNNLLNFIFQANLKDVLSGYRAFSRDFVKNIKLLSQGFEIETEISAYALHNKYIIKEVVIPYKDRAVDNPSKLNTYKDGFRVLRMIFIIIKNYHPFYFFSFIALIIFTIAIFLTVPVFNEYFETGMVARFPTLIFGCFLFMSALQLFCCGLILQVIKNH